MSEDSFDGDIVHTTDTEAWRRNPRAVEQRLETTKAILAGELELIPTGTPAFEGIEDAVRMARAELNLTEAEASGDPTAIQSAKEAKSSLIDEVVTKKEAEIDEEDDVEEETIETPYKDHYFMLGEGHASLKDLHRLQYPNDPYMVEKKTVEALEALIEQRKDQSP